MVQVKEEKKSNAAEEPSHRLAGRIIGIVKALIPGCGKKRGSKKNHSGKTPQQVREQLQNRCPWWSP